MHQRKTYIITWFDPRRDAPAAKSYYRYNRTQTVQGYSKAIRTAKLIAAHFGIAILWDQNGVIEPENGHHDHSYINVYSG